VSFLLVCVSWLVARVLFSHCGSFGIPRVTYATWLGWDVKKSSEVQKLLDTDAGDDGVVTKEEFMTKLDGLVVATPPPPPPMSDAITMFWNKLDTDGSGTLTSAEVWKGVKDGHFKYPGHPPSFSPSRSLSFSVALCCSLLLSVALCRSLLLSVALCRSLSLSVALYRSLSLSVALCCSLLLSVALCSSL